MLFSQRIKLIVIGKAGCKMFRFETIQTDGSFDDINKQVEDIVQRDFAGQLNKVEKFYWNYA